MRDLVTHDEDIGNASNAVWNTAYQYNAAGQLTYADVNDGLAKDVYYQLDAAGQVIARQESRTSTPSAPAPRELLYRFGGRTIGMTGNNGTGAASYGASVAALAAITPSTAQAGLFRAVVSLNTGNGTTPYSTWTARTDTAASYADFSQSIDPYNTGNQGSAGGASYTVRGGGGEGGSPTSSNAVRATAASEFFCHSGGIVGGTL